MSARVLVVDDQEANVRLLEAKLKAEYFEVVTAFDGPSALEKAQTEQPDVILLDIMMPGMDGFEVCRRLKSDRRTRHIPVIHVTALDQPADRVRGLESGADDFLTKPVDNLPLFARLRSLLRLKELLDELRLREERAEERGVALDDDLDVLVDEARVLLVAGEERVAQHIARKLPETLTVETELTPERAVELAGKGYDLVVVDLTAKEYDALRVCARIRSNNETRSVPILAVVDPDEMSRSVRALDLGVNDIVNRPIDTGELNARIRTQLRRKRYADTLRERLENSLEMAVIDPLTGLHNRRYLASRLQQAAEMVAGGEMVASVVIADLDHFKRVNDTYGHDAGDAVLVEFAARVRKQLRAVDLAARFGGEEFVILMPEASLMDARTGAERLRNAIAEQPFVLPGEAGSLDVTVSIGVAQIRAGQDGEAVMRRADEALYRAKASGRNTVVVEEAVKAA